MNVRELNERFGMRGLVEVMEGNGGLPAVQVHASATSGGSAGLVYLHGGHVAAWKPAGMEEVLWLSGKSLWQAGKAIRGGVPVCFPWFGPRKGDGQAPVHGLARLREWVLESVETEDGEVTVTLATTSDEETRKVWSGEFTLRHRVTFGAELAMALEVTNTGSAMVDVEEAQHTYFTVRDVRRVRVSGLAGVCYLDKVDGMKEKVQEGDITITGETDRVYIDTGGEVAIEDPVLGRRITVHKEHSRATVVWNPWIAKAKAMGDFGDDEWPGMLCVESCNVGACALRLGAGQRHVMTSRIRAQRL